jgi:hypothetical protein
MSEWSARFATVLAIGSLGTTSLTGAGPPDCCRLFGLDATPVLGDDPALCGQIRDADDRPDAEILTREERKQAARCARDAQAAGRAFVYTYRQLISPDVDMVVQGVAGMRGERLLLKLGNFRGENLHSMEVCAELEVLADGRIQSRGCTRWHPLLEKLRAPFPVRQRLVR